MINYFIEWFKHRNDEAWKAARLNESKVKCAQRGRTDIKTWKTWEHHGWGNAISVSNTNSRWDGHGFLWGRFSEVGDELLFRTRGGYNGKCIFLTIKPCGDPNDMFFFDLSEPIFIKEAELLEKQKVLTP